MYDNRTDSGEKTACAKFSTYPHLLKRICKDLSTDFVPSGGICMIGLHVFVARGNFLFQCVTHCCE